MKLGWEDPAPHFIKAKVAIPARALEENPGQWVAMARDGLAKSGYAGKVHPTTKNLKLGIIRHNTILNLFTSTYNTINKSD